MLKIFIALDKNKYNLKLCFNKMFVFYNNGIIIIYITYYIYLRRASNNENA